jgi:hypothetical protein
VLGPIPGLVNGGSDTMTAVEEGQNDSLGTKEGVALAAGWDDLVSLTERIDFVSYFCNFMDPME